MYLHSDILCLRCIQCSIGSSLQSFSSATYDAHISFSKYLPAPPPPFDPATWKLKIDKFYHFISSFPVLSVKLFFSPYILLITEGSDESHLKKRERDFTWKGRKESLAVYCFLLCVIFGCLIDNIFLKNKNKKKGRKVWILKSRYENVIDLIWSWFCIFLLCIYIHYIKRDVVIAWFIRLS